MERLNSPLVTAAQIKAWTERDPCLSKVRKLVLEGWTETKGDEQFKPYATRKDELSVKDGCVLWGIRVVVPPQLHSRVMDELHEGHPGIGKMKSFARGYVWWPGLDADLEQKVRKCLVCQSTQKAPAKSPIHPWEWPEKPWARLHIDHAGPYWGKHCSASWTHIRNGSTRTSSRLHRQQRLSKNYVRHVPLTVSHRRWSLIMAQHSLRVNSKSLCGVMA